MKYIAICLVLATVGCAHTAREVTAQDRRQQVAETAWDFVEKEINQKATLYGSLVQGARFLRLHDMEMTKDAEAGIVVVNALGENHEHLGRIFVYLLCYPNGTCVIAQVASESVAPVTAPQTDKNDETRL